jgi:hypothetical protein
VAASIAVLAAGVVSGAHMRSPAILVMIVTLIALSGTGRIGWPKLIASLILVILFIPMRRYSLPGNLPFQLEPYRILVALLVLLWIASLLVDPNVRFRRSGFEAPLVVIIGSIVASVVFNPGRVSDVSSIVDKKLMFFLSFVLVLYLTTSVIRRLDNIDYLIKTLVGGGAVVSFFAIVEARTGFNVFNHLSRVVPFLKGGDIAGPSFILHGSSRLRVFASAEHPIALSAALVMLAPLALYLARRYRQRRWYVAALVLALGVVGGLSRTGITMLMVVLLVFLWLRPRETRRMWPAIIPALIVVHIALPGSLGALKNSFLPAGGVVAQQSSAGGSGSGRLADLHTAGPLVRERPLIGQGYGTRVPDPDNTTDFNAQILDDQWLGTLLETGALGVFGWLWLFVRVMRRFGGEARQDDSDRGWLLVSIAASVAAYAIGMLTYDAFSFIQVTFLLFIFIGIGSALMAERPIPVAVRARRARASMFPKPADVGGRA